MLSMLDVVIEQSTSATECVCHDPSMYDVPKSCAPCLERELSWKSVRR